jgi:(1->4)-alpha-D-glucan 1-alpha-D-glucosylmutase
VSEEDERFVSGAIENAKAKRTDLDPELFRFLKDLLLLRVGGRLEGELAMRFQQLTAPAMAKGVEDTAFYRFNRLVCLNEVGGDPDRFGISLPEFHEWCAKAQEERPFSLLASTTHDTKRSEDVRARLALLSEIPGRWAAAVARWAEGNARFRIRNAPDRNTEYLFYQTLVGAWPIDHVRISAYMKKAVRESKMETSWTKPNIPYEDGLEGFIKDVLTNDDFLADVKGFVAHLTVPGRLNSLSQTLLKLTAPGVPDIYQGSEIWNMTLVDPDNRGQVDYTQRRNLLDRLLNSSLDDIVAAMEEGLPKLWVIRQALGLRGASPQAFGPDGSYRPLYARGEKADHLIAFVRGERIVTLAPRLVMQLNGEWSQTTVELPRGTWKNILTGDDVEGGVNELRNLLTRFPVGLLVRNPG